jgi:hypothetical protein
MTRHGANHSTVQDTTPSTTGPPPISPSDSCDAPVVFFCFFFFGGGGVSPLILPAWRSLFDRLAAGGCATLQVGCIRGDTWDPRRSLVEAYSNDTDKVPHASETRCSVRVSACTRFPAHHGRGEGSGPRLGMSKQARDPETWAVGRSLAADADALSRQLGEGLASIVPTSPDSQEQGHATSSPPRRCNLRPTARLLQP